ncbi:hypothetical protein ID866_8666 [Astraeus odoratus]|nr:hypothetical protein ID866_8666 [Astraeus odoratus]
MSSIAAQFLRQGKKIVAIGRNYSEHIKELGNTAPKEPFFFLKPTTSYISSGGSIEIPRGVIPHHEVELGLVIGKGGREISQGAAESHIAGYALAIDMTARNMQEEVKKKGLPWKFIPKSAVSDPHDLRLLLTVNGVTKQKGTTGDMIFRIPRLIEHISSIMALEVTWLTCPSGLQLTRFQEGDLILTGTPSGVGPVAPGDKIECTLADPSGNVLDAINFTAILRNSGYQFKL